MKVLAFDTSSTALSVALMEKETLLAEQLVTVKKNHSISLMPTIDFMMEQVGWLPADLERIVVAQGPGSYTGLRVAVATAKTLAYTLGIGLVGLSSLYALTAGAHQGVVIPLIDARRNHVYVGFYDNGRALQPDCHASFDWVLEQSRSYDSVTFVGEVAAFREQIEAALPQANVVETQPSAALLAREGQKLTSVSVHAFVPQYLKRVEAEENWLKTNTEGNTTYIKRV